MSRNKKKVTLLLIFIIGVSVCGIILFTPKEAKNKLSFNKTYYNFLMK